MYRSQILRKSLPLFLIIWSICAYGQSGTFLTGTIKEESGGLLAGASIVIKGTSTGVTADEKGFFRIGLKKAGSYTIEISAVGFISQTQVVNLAAGQESNITFLLKSNVKEMNEVTVHGKGEAQELREQGFSVNAIDTRKLANTTADLGQVLNRSTGIKMREQGGVGSDFEFSINGLSGKSVKLFLDGVPLDVLGSAMNLNNIPINLAQRIEVYKGVAPVELGSDALGGSVNIITNKSLDSYLDVSHSYGSFQTHQSALTGQYVYKPAGLVLKASTFFNYSKNNYLMKGVEIWDGEKYEYVTRDFRRFHDRYKSLMGQLEIGLVNKKWADLLFLGFGYTTYDKQVQTGVRQSIIYGGVVKDGTGKNVSLRYKKDSLLNNRLSIGLYGTYSYDQYVLSDTTLRKYSWDGSYVPGNPETGSFRMTQVNRPRLFTRFNGNYNLAENHDLNLNYTFDQVENQTYNSLSSSRDDMPGKLGKHIIGLAYQMKLTPKWTNTFMSKYYGIALNKKQYDYSLSKTVVLRDFQNYFGYGWASVYKLNNNSGVKASYEHTYRLQDVNEVYGDGYQVLNNMTLKPEASDNVNMGGFYGGNNGRQEWFVEASAFYRSAKGFIYANQYDNNQLQYQNLSNVLVKGFDAEARYNYGNLFNALLNVTYQQALDNTRFVNNSGNGAVSATYKNRIPNQPWLFGNLDLGVGKNLRYAGSGRLQFTWSTQYTHYYYRSWEGFATANSLATIPKQLVHNVMLSYSMAKGRYNASLECRNLTDQLVYDNFRLQKPGRAIFFKLRFFII
ncbi:Outer membrane receptor proteins, mostly Fe transport [Dyadobacter koreensis]|uniref:Outer membrane receptor proteins, mostly Fe transport n=1 Tax=Dyadobacter koreensis TaxID=408657 RepID=A0A1H6QJW2_9BACT|nr:TonB-dependent receptor [Dyadobacter koreensis]SEI41234.1 Outer membrane receptor proteins, mostly Fe transport [Dyadobacter koreensis]